MRHLPTVKQLQYFVALKDSGSFSKAASACNVTQSTLSAGIAALEETLGQQLVDRSRRHLVLTPIGEEMLEKAQKILSSSESMLDRALHIKAPLTGPLRLGIIPTIAPYLLPRILPQITQAHKSLELQLHEEQSAELVDKLRNGQLDLGLLAFPYPAEGLTEHILFDEDFMLATPHGYWQKKNALTPDALQNHRKDLLLLEDGHCLRDHALAACRLPGLEARKTFNATSLPTLIEMVRHGYGITLLPEMAVKSAFISDDIDILPFKSPAPIRTIGLMWRSNHVRGSEFEILGQTIKEAHLTK